jgi:hypothetical protein
VIQQLWYLEHFHRNHLTYSYQPIPQKGSNSHNMKFCHTYVLFVTFNAKDTMYSRRWRSSCSCMIYCKACWRAPGMSKDFGSYLPIKPCDPCLTSNVARPPVLMNHAQSETNTVTPRYLYSHSISNIPESQSIYSSEPSHVRNCGCSFGILESLILWVNSGHCHPIGVLLFSPSLARIGVQKL